jgi:hypothetical protein
MICIFIQIYHLISKVSLNYWADRLVISLYIIKIFPYKRIQSEIDNMMINRSLWNHYLTLISLIWSIIIMIHWMACCFHFINELEIFFEP